MDWLHWVLIMGLIIQSLRLLATPSINEKQAIYYNSNNHTELKRFLTKARVATTLDEFQEAIAELKTDTKITGYYK